MTPVSPLKKSWNCLPLGSFSEITDNFIVLAAFSQRWVISSDVCSGHF